MLLWVLFGISCLAAVVSHLGIFDTAKTVLNYLSPAVIATATYNLFRYGMIKVTFRFLLAVSLVWAVVGFVQMVFYPEFMTFILNQSGRGFNAWGRGIVSLATEPAFYGSMCVFFVIIALINLRPHQAAIIGIIQVFQIVFLARSATALAILLVGCVLFVILSLLLFRFKPIVLTAVFAVMSIPVFFFVSQQMAETRIGKLIKFASENPAIFITADESVGMRFAFAYIPIYALADKKLKPSGYGTYGAYLSQLYTQQKLRGFLTPHIVHYHKRIGGGINMAIFHFGGLGLLFPLAVFLAFKKHLRSTHGLLAFAILFCVLMTQIQLMNGIIGFILGNALFLGASPDRGQISIDQRETAS